jgi:hypothetical protein
MLVTQEQCRNRLVAVQNSGMAESGGSTSVQWFGPLNEYVGSATASSAFHKNDHGPSYRSWRALQRYKRLNIDFREIFRVVRFSTFSTVSAKRTFANRSMSAMAA